jgi:pimeloyl-ACP methyl ester carboxylesterase
MYLLVNGAKTFAGTGGRDFDPALPLVVFVHGAGLDHTVWSLLARWFANRGASVLAPDLPGHGRSGGEALGSIAALADWTAAFIAAAKAGGATIIGHSMGCLVAVETAARHPDKVGGIGLILRRRRHAGRS